MEPIGPLSRAASIARTSAESKESVDPRLRTAFLRMVQHELHGGVLRYSRRKELVRFARRLGLSEFDAHLLIAQAQYGSPSAEPSATVEPVEPAYLVAPRPTPAWLKVSLALLVAAAVDLALIYWVLL